MSKNGKLVPDGDIGVVVAILLNDICIVGSGVGDGGGGGGVVSV